MDSSPSRLNKLEKELALARELQLEIPESLLRRIKRLQDQNILLQRLQQHKELRRNRAARVSSDESPAAVLQVGSPTPKRPHAQCTDTLPVFGLSTDHASSRAAAAAAAAAGSGPLPMLALQEDVLAMQTASRAPQDDKLRLELALEREVRQPLEELQELLASVQEEQQLLREEQRWQAQRLEDQESQQLQSQQEQALRLEEALLSQSMRREADLESELHTLEHEERELEEEDRRLKLKAAELRRLEEEVPSSPPFAAGTFTEDVASLEGDEISQQFATTATQDVQQQPHHAQPDELRGQLLDLQHQLLQQEQQQAAERERLQVAQQKLHEELADMQKQLKQQQMKSEMQDHSLSAGLEPAHSHGREEILNPELRLHHVQREQQLGQLEPQNLDEKLLRHGNEGCSPGGFSSAVAESTCESARRRPAETSMRVSGAEEIEGSESQQVPPVYQTAIAIILEHGWDVLHGGQNAGPAWTPLHWAASEGHYGICSMLLRCRADPTYSDEMGRSPLHYATLHGHATTAALLHEARNSATVDEMLLPRKLLLSSECRAEDGDLEDGRLSLASTSGGALSGAPSAPSGTTDCCRSSSLAAAGWQSGSEQRV